MGERWAEAFEEWAAEHPLAATAIGTGMLFAITVVGLLAAGQSAGFALITGAAVGLLTLGLFTVVARLTGRPVMFGLFGAGARAPGDLGTGSYGDGWFGGDGGGGDGGS